MDQSEHRLPKLKAHSSKRSLTRIVSNAKQITVPVALNKSNMRKVLRSSSLERISNSDDLEHERRHMT